ncbi:MAG: uracil phosphoribosyltransferase, partial [Limnochordales bacterium]
MLRDERTGPKDFRELMEEIAMLMAYEVTRDIATEPVEVQTPVARAQGRVVSGKKLAVLAILRAGPG